jgi:transcriptional regulator with PAS, ATPase and Fis domain
MDALSRYSWPGNIRELQNLLSDSSLAASGEMHWSKPNESIFYERFAKAIGTRAESLHGLPTAMGLKIAA